MMVTQVSDKNKTAPATGVQIDLAPFFNAANKQQKYADYEKACVAKRSELFESSKKTACFNEAPADLKVQKTKNNDTIELLNREEFKTFEADINKFFREKYHVTMKLDFDDAAAMSYRKPDSKVILDDTPQGIYNPEVVSRQELVQYMQQRVEGHLKVMENSETAIHFVDSVAKSKVSVASKK